jgi:hypothetical protein
MTLEKNKALISLDLRRTLRRLSNQVRPQIDGVITKLLWKRFFRVDGSAYSFIKLMILNMKLNSAYADVKRACRQKTMQAKAARYKDLSLEKCSQSTRNFDDICTQSTQANANISVADKVAITSK